MGAPLDEFTLNRIYKLHDQGVPPLTIAERLDIHITTVRHRLIQAGLHERKTFVLTDPQGNTYRGNNLKRFCEERGLTYRLIHKVASGQTFMGCGGWRQGANQGVAPLRKRTRNAKYNFPTNQELYS